MKENKIFDHLPIEEGGRVPALLLVWTLAIRVPTFNIEWTAHAQRHLTRLLRLTGDSKDNAPIHPLGIQRLLELAQTLSHEEVISLLEELDDSGRLDCFLRILGISLSEFDSLEQLSVILHEGELVPFDSVRLASFNLRWRKAILFGALCSSGVILNTGYIDFENVRKALIDWAWATNSKTGIDAKKMQLLEDLNNDELLEMVRLCRYVTPATLALLDDETQRRLFTYRRAESLEEMMRLVAHAKEVLEVRDTSHHDLPSNPGELGDLPSTAFPSLTKRGVNAAKMLAYCLGRVPLEERRLTLWEELRALEEKTAKRLLVSVECDLTSAEVKRISDGGYVFIHDLLQRQGRDRMKKLVLNLADQAHLLE